MKLLVVGGSSGIGLAVAQHAASAGHDVIVAARRTVEDLHSVELDVRDPHAVARAFDSIEGLDAVLYASGIAQLAPLSEQSPDDWRDTLETNLVGAALVAQHAIPLLSHSNGVMLFCSSTTDDEHRWGLGAYGVSKAALNRLVEGLRAEQPDVRFTRTTLGPTLTIGFAAEWDADLLNDAFARWVKEGQQKRNAMPVESVAQVLLTLITTLLEHPDVAIPEVHVEPPGS
jgi:NAD(P)-dependent dehydrogenase (short-subunit alcohol dehydrogenase family)